MTVENSGTPVVPATPETSVVPATPETPVVPVSPQGEVVPPADASAQPPAPSAEQGQPPVERVVPAADGYKLPEGAPEGLGQFANANGMTQEQVDGSMAFYGKLMQTSKAAEATAMKNAGQALVDSWGESSKYNLSLAKKALAMNDPDKKLATFLDQSGFGNHPEVISFLHRIGQNLQEGGFLKGAVNRPVGQKTAAQKMYGDSHPSQS